MDNILIIDDEPQIRKLLSCILELEGYEVGQAANCQVAMKMLEQSQPAVVLCDVFLPDGIGKNCQKVLKKMQTGY